MQHSGMEKTNKKRNILGSIINRRILLSLVACNLLPEEKSGVEFQKYYHYFSLYF
jgi:hypothetical protein